MNKEWLKEAVLELKDCWDALPEEDIKDSSARAIMAVGLFSELRKEDRIKEMQAQRLEERNHDWTKDPATESQVLFLKKCNYNGDFKGMTKGLASILIDKYKKDVGGLI